MQEINVSTNEDLDQWEDQAKGLEVIQDYEKMIRSKKKVILYVAFRQGRVSRDSKTQKDIEKWWKNLV